MKKVHGHIVDAMYIFSLKWAYCTDINVERWDLDQLDSSDKKCMKQALNLFGIKEEIFVKSFKMWCRFMKLRFPIPRLV